MVSISSTKLGWIKKQINREFKNGGKVLMSKIS